MGNMDKNLQRNNVAGQVEGFCISYFAAFKSAFDYCCGSETYFRILNSFCEVSLLHQHLPV